MAGLINEGKYVETKPPGCEYLRPSVTKACHIYRARGIFSFFKYYVLKHCSSSWKEEAIKTKHATEKVLINKDDRDTLVQSGLIQTPNTIDVD
jgi:hypothetical protein